VLFQCLTKVHFLIYDINTNCLFEAYSEFEIFDEQEVFMLCKIMALLYV